MSGIHIKHMEHGTHDTCFNHFPFSFLLFIYFHVFYLLSAFILLTLFDCALRKQFANCLKRRNESQIEKAGRVTMQGSKKGGKAVSCECFFDAVIKNYFISFAS